MNARSPMAAPGNTPAIGFYRCCENESGVFPRMKLLMTGLGSICGCAVRDLRELIGSCILLYRSHQSALPDAEIAGLPVETDLRAALAHRPEAVIISNPTALHLDVAIPAAEAACAILLEKPIAHTLERVAEFRAAVQ